MIKQRQWQWSEETEIAVVVSNEQNEIEKFEAWGLDIEPHRLKMNTYDLEKDFKDDTILSDLLSFVPCGLLGLMYQVCQLCTLISR